MGSGPAGDRRRSVSPAFGQRLHSQSFTLDVWPPGWGGCHLTLRWLALLLVVCPSLLAGGGGCARALVVTITADPPDALIRVDNRDRGRGPLTETFTFNGD